MKVEEITSPRRTMTFVIRESVPPASRRVRAQKSASDGNEVGVLEPVGNFLQALQGIARFLRSAVK